MKNLLFYMLIFVFNVYKVYSTHFLTKSQWYNINKIIKHPSSTNEMKNKIHNIIFVYYNDWSWSKAYYFKKKHPYKCHHIPLNELSIYASLGLLKSIRNYKGTSEFTQYATFYIESELYNAITNLHPITPISKRIRKKQKNMETYTYNNDYNPPVILINNNEWLLNKYLLERYEETKMENHDKYTYSELWSKIHNLELDSLTKTILHYKFTHIFEKKRTNNEISNMLDISEETVRQKLYSVKIDSKFMDY